MTLATYTWRVCLASGVCPQRDAVAKKLTGKWLAVKRMNQDQVEKVDTREKNCIIFQLRFVWSHQPTSFASFGATKVYYSKKIKEKKPSAKTPWASDRTKTECSSGWCSWHVGDHQVDCYAPSHVGPPQWGGSMGPLCKPSTPCPSDLKNLFQKVSKIPQKLAAFAI